MITKNLKFVKFRIYGNLWEKKESSGMILIFDPQCHTLVTFFFKLAHKLQEELEKDQNHAARFVTRNYVYETGSMTGILGQLKWESLKEKEKG